MAVKNLKDCVICVVGGGVVGTATADVFRDYCRELYVWDIDEKKQDMHEMRIEGALRLSHIVFLCLPETELDNWCGKYLPLQYNLPEDVYRNTHFVIRSTCPVGTTSFLQRKYSLPHVYHWPEFLSERTAEHDSKNPSTIMLGRPDAWKMHPTYNLLLSILYQRFPTIPISPTSSEESEMAKIAQNAFFCVKLSFFNELNLLCERMGVDYKSVVRLMCADYRISEHHTQVPGPDGKYGYGGKCLEKDLRQFVAMCAKEKLVSVVGEASLRANKEHRTRKVKGK